MNSLLSPKDQRQLRRAARTLRHAMTYLNCEYNMRVVPDGTGRWYISALRGDQADVKAHDIICKIYSYFPARHRTGCPGCKKLWALARAVEG